MARMDPWPVSRRTFLKVTAAVGLGPALMAAAASRAPAWTIGCLNRPWTKWSAAEMLAGVKAAGYRVVGLQTATPADPFNGANATPEYLATLKEKIAAHGLTAIQGRLRTLDAAAFDEAAANIRKQVDHTRILGLKTLLNTGTARPELYENWYRLMSFAAAYAADSGIQIVTKPHGGVTATGADLLRCLEKVKHANFGIWYDAGNILYYTGLDPLAELEPIVGHVTAFTAKDCAGKGGEVMIQFGRGRVEFTALFQRLRRAGFAGPVIVECCAIGDTAPETAVNARANREFLERTLATL